MALMDDLKKKTEEGLKTLKETAQDLAFNVEKQAKISKRRYVDITKIQRTVQKTIAEIGEHVYDILSSAKALDKDDPFLKDKVAAISRMQMEINDIEDEIAAIEHTKPPKHESE
jgi:hypothetical protein